MTAHVATLQAEYRSNSPWVATPTPRLTWTVQDDGTDWVQAWAEIRADDGEPVRREGRESVLVDWPFDPLVGDRPVEVRVRVASTGGTVTPWSEPVQVRHAALPEGGWTASFIGLPDPAGHAQPFLARRTVEVRDVRSAVLRWTALGVTEVRLDGQTVDDAVMGPGWPAYADRLVHETVDVTHLVRDGQVTLAASVAGAWYTERYGFQGNAKVRYGDQPAVAVQLDLVHGDGSRSVVTTDGSWRVSPGPVVTSGLYAGESYDARAEVPGWDTPGFDDAAWSAASVRGGEHPVPEPRLGPPTRRVEEVAPVEVLTTPTGATVLDYGQNLVGRLRIRVRGEAGATVTLRHAEVLEDGELALRPLRLAAATDTYVLAGRPEGETWEPAFTFHGFRYAQVDGWAGDLDPADVTAVVLHDDMDRTGTFHTSHALVDRLHENVVQGMRGNFLAVPTDCPQRDERLGWTGDIGVFAPTAASLFDVRGFLASWLRDLSLEQHHHDGVVPVVVPDALGGFGPGTRPLAAWGDAATVVPWTLWERYGDRGVLAAQYPSMRAWADVLLAESDGTGLWEGSFQLGDWLDPSAPPDRPAQARTSTDIVASAYLALSLRLVAQAARVLGHDDDAASYADTAEHAREAFVGRFVTPAGRMMSDAPTAYALALRFDLVKDPALRERLAGRLAELVRADGYRIGTGFVGTPLVPDALTDHGHHRTAARLLLQTECPSWLYPVTMGATTVWERWDSMLPDGSVNPGEMTSFNHYALGAVADWLHRVVAGLAPDAPGYARLRIAPRVLPGLDDAAVTIRTPYGPAGVSWRRDGDEVEVRAVVPPNTTALVDLEGAPAHEVGSGEHRWTVPLPARLAPQRRRPLGVGSPTAAVIDDEEAYAALVRVLRERAPEAAEGLLRGIVWSEQRDVRGSLLFAPPELVDEVDRALVALT